MLHGFVPLYWAPDGHSQSCISLLYKRDTSVSYERELLEMADHEYVALDWAAVDGVTANDGPVCMILAGLGGNSDDLLAVAGVAVRQGFRTVVVNKRGHASGLTLVTPKLLSFGDTSDLRQVVLELKKRFADMPLVAIGFSAGSGLLASYVQDYLTDSFLDGMVCISAGYNTMELFCTGGGTVPWPYDGVLLLGQKRLVEKNCATLKGHIDIDAVRKSRTLNEYTTVVDMPTYGISTLEEYWSVNNPLRGSFKHSNIPTLCINARDDPIVVETMIPVKQFQQEWKSVVLLLSDRGGHCGFLEGWRGSHWDHKVACKFLHFITSAARKGK